MPVTITPDTTPETTHRFHHRATMLAFVVTASACMAEVGGEECVGKRCGRTDAGTATERTCDDPEEVVRDLTIRDATDLEGLPSGCWSLNGDLRVEGGSITTLAGLGELIEVNDLSIVDSSLSSIDTKRTIRAWGSLLVAGNAKLTTLDRVAVERWTGSVTGGATWEVGYTVRDNAVLTSLGALAYVREVDRDLRITGNPKLGAIAFEDLARVGGGLHVTKTGATAIELPSLSSAVRIEISDNPKLTTVSSLDVTSLPGGLVLRRNPVLTQLGPLTSLISISGALVVDDNDALVDLSNLVPASRIDGTISITNNAKLANLGRLARLPQGIESSVTITGNSSLVSCRANEVAHCGQVGSPGAVIEDNGSQLCSGCYCGR